MTPEPVFDPSKAWVSQTLKHEGMLTSCRFSPCGRFVAAGGTDRRLHVWELAGEKKAAIAGHEGWITALAFSPDGGRLFSADFHGALRAWIAEAPAWSVPIAHPGGVCALAVSPDGNLVATGGHDCRVRLWRADDGKLERELWAHAGYVYSLAFHPDGRSLVSGDLMGVVNHWGLAFGEVARVLEAGTLHTRLPDFLADVGGVRAMGFDREGRTLACGGLLNAKSNTFCPGEPAVLLFDWATGDLRATLRGQGKVDGTVNAVRVLPDGSIAAVAEGFAGGAVWFWKPDQPEPFHALPGTSVYDLDLHPDGLRLAAAAFVERGRGGNGRHAKKGEYVSHVGAVRIVSLFAPPPKGPPGKPPARKPDPPK